MAEPSTTIWEFLERNWPTISVVVGGAIASATGLAWKIWGGMKSAGGRLIEWARPQIEQVTTGHVSLLRTLEESFPQIHQRLETLETKADEASQKLTEVHNLVKRT